MRTVTHRSFLFVSALALIALGSAGCEIQINDLDDGCFGDVRRNVAIPDLILVGQAELYVRDLLADPEVFFHTDDAFLYFDADADNSRIVEAYTDNGFLYVEPLRVGTTRVVVRAEDDCGSRARTSFLVDVIPAKAGS
ncbi:MAG: hypothetical protein AAF752_09550 [Bacteroidota bacterium]